MASKTLTRWTQLGFFVEEGDVLRVSDSVGTGDAEPHGHLRRAVLRLLLDPANNPNLAEEVEDAEGTLASDFTRAAAWVLDQDPYVFHGVVSHADVQGVEIQQRMQPRVFQNDTRWNGFKEWVVFSGLAWPSGKRIVADPSHAVAHALEGVFAQDRQLAVSAFLEAIGRAVPVLDGGVYRLTVEAQIGSPWRNRSPKTISPCLSAALFSLQARGVVGFEIRSDAPQMILLGRGGRELQPISHVVLKAVSGVP